MAKKFRHPETGAIIRIELTAQELAERVLHIDLEQLVSWQSVIKPKHGKGEKAVYSIDQENDLKKIKNLVALLKTGMTPTAVKNVEKAGFLPAYAALAEDCPEGLTVHVWRSYALVVLMQIRYGKMITAKELAERGKIVKKVDGKIVSDVAMAEKHLRLLQGLKYLEANLDEGRWEHQGLPQSWTDSD
jgi:hypothetical protein